MKVLVHVRLKKQNIYHCKKNMDVLFNNSKVTGDHNQDMLNASWISNIMSSKNVLFLSIAINKDHITLHQNE